MINLNKIKTWLLFIVCLFLCIGPVQASTINELNAEGRVKLTAWLSNGVESVALHEQVVINIEVATDTWFTKGTRVHRIEVDNALVVNRSAFAINSTERINGKTYSKQLWEIVLYPLESGEYRVPPITVELEVKNDRQNVSGLLTTIPLTFEAHKPIPYMVESHHWITASELEITEEWQVIHANQGESTDTGLLKRALDKEVTLSVGDSLKRVVTTTATDTSTMLLPDLLNMPKGMDDRLTFYRHATQHEDREIRGERYSKKVESATYIVDQAGEITLPSVDIYWWNPNSSNNKKMTIQKSVWLVSHTYLSLIDSYKHTILMATLFLGLCCYLFYRVGKYYKEHPLPRWFRALLTLNNKSESKFETILYEIKLVKFGQYRLLSHASHSKGTTYDDLKVVHERHNRKGKSKLSRFTRIKIWISLTTKKY
ncbi:BatD family protein [Vibrio sp. ZSDE26]|uniref:BatD family protein n=1 Tax=Vibrio amylolyticus TaxID=2847292 RepID=A0A9X1XIL6_9VIBR|nr:BatD family protein [Vibrio amylolyticus]MCK6263476.1 BatD family protein [Vibrio amylolyticus]